MNNKRLRVAVASSGLGHVARGMEAWAESLAAALNEQGVDVTLFRGAGPIKNSYDEVLPCIRRGARLAQIGPILNNVGGWRVGLGSEAQVESFTYGIRLLWKLREGYDLAHIQQGSLALFLNRAEKLGLLKCPIVFGNGQKAPPQFLARFPYLHFLSPYGMKEITDHVQKRPEWRVIPNFVDTKLFSPGDKTAARKSAGLPEEGFIVLSVGMVDKEVKRMDYFVKEAAMLVSGSSERINFVIAGSKHKDSLEIEEMGKTLLGNRLTILYDLGRERMPDLFRSADVFVLCSPREALAMALIEAMACGVPAICDTFPVMKWVVDKGGICVDMDKSGRLRDALVEFCSDPDLRRSAGTIAREVVQERFSTKAVTTEIIDMYRDVIAQQPARGRAKEPKRGGETG